MIKLTKTAIIDFLDVKMEECIAEMNKTKCNDMWNSAKLELLDEINKFIINEVYED
jgi:hypothetical protein